MIDAFQSVLTDAGFQGAFCQTLILILLGWFLYRRGVLTERAKAPMMTLIWKIAVPCMAFNAFMTDFSGQQFARGLWVMVIALTAYILVALFARLAFRRALGARGAGAAAMLCAVGQLTLFAMPVLRSMYAGQSDALIPVSIMTIPFRVMVYVVALIVISGIKPDRAHLGASVRQILLNPIILAMLSGMAIYLTQNILPKVTVNGAQVGILRVDLTLGALYTPVKALEKLVNPLAMLLIGMSLGEQNPREALTDRTAWAAALVRTLVAPALTLMLALLLEIVIRVRLGEYELMTLALGMAAPASVSVSLYCVDYDNQALFASRACLLSTFACVLAMPINCALARLAATLML